jgi:hypothetical protein
VARDQLQGPSHSKRDGFPVATPQRTVRRSVLASSAVGAAILFCAANACEPTVIVGHRACSESAGDATVAPDPTTPVTLPWSTGFEAGFCDYALPSGFCFATGSGSFSIVTSPVHSGQYAAAFSVRGDADAGQARCVQQGVFPSTAYFGAWYYVPAPAVNSSNWNLLHFQGGADGGLPAQSLWDVSLVNQGDGGALSVILFDPMPHPAPALGAVPPIPIGQWFHLELYFKRASDATGELTLWQDDVKAADLSGLVTDNTDWGQFYVGNLANALVPPASTIYVDDVTIAAER